MSGEARTAGWVSVPEAADMIGLTYKGMDYRVRQGHVRSRWIERPRRMRVVRTDDVLALRQRFDRRRACIPKGWLVCGYCPPGDNEWTADAFTACGWLDLRDRRKLMCNDCFESRYPRRKVVCKGGCGKVIGTRGRGPGICRPCRRSGKGP